MQAAGLTVEFNSTGVTISMNGQDIFEGTCKSNVSIVNFKINHKAYTTYPNRNQNYSLWHERLGHISKGKFLEIVRNNMFEDVELVKFIKFNNELCEACINGKQARLPFEKIKNKEYIKRHLIIIHSDVCGPITPSSIDGRNYYVIFVDQYTHYCVTYLMTYKSVVFNFFKDFIAKSEAHFNL